MIHRWLLGQCKLSLCLLFLSQPFITTTALLKMYPLLFGEQIWKSGFWRYQKHLFLKLAAQATNAAQGWIFAADPYFSERAILSSTRNNEIFNVLWKILNNLKGLKKGSCTPSLETTAGSLSDVTEKKNLWDQGPLVTPSVFSFLSEPAMSH